MNPWNIIGWAIVLLASSAVVVSIGPLVIGWIWRRYYHYKTRNIEPRQWQVWMQGDAPITVTRITEHGRICLSTAHCKNGRQFGPFGSSASWSDSPEAWRERVRQRKLWLLVDDADRGGVR